MNIEVKIKEIIPNEKEYIWGFADLTNLLIDKYKGHDYGIVIGKKLDNKIIDSIESGPTLPYFNLYHEVNADLLKLEKKIASQLSTLNISSIVIGPTSTDEDINSSYGNTLRSNFSHKMAGTRAGLGWVGKTDLFISEKFGPRLRLATILMNHPVKSLNPPINESKCGDCTICVKKCPAQAANGKSWNINIYRDEFYDPHKCRKKALELSKITLDKKISLCGICVSVCPFGKKK